MKTATSPKAMTIVTMYGYVHAQSEKMVRKSRLDWSEHEIVLFTLSAMNFLLLAFVA